jgi:hypothetical protein
MKAQYPECKILLFSGQAITQDLLKEARDQGHSFQFLQKPVHPSVMLSRIGALAMESSLASSRASLRPVSALRVKPSRRNLRMPRRTRNRALREKALYEGGGAASIQQAIRYEGEAKPQAPTLEIV